MRRYSDGRFISEEPRRGRERDEYRDRFFLCYSGDRLKDPFDIVSQTDDMAEKVIELLGLAADGIDGDRSALDIALAEIGSLRLGRLIEGGHANSISGLRYADVTLPAFAANFFGGRISGSPSTDTQTDD